MKKPRTRTDVERRYEVDKIFRDSDGWWVWLKPGYWSSNMECGTIREDTLREVFEQFDYVERAPLDYMVNAGYDLAAAIQNWEGEPK